jgi:hypothetical protein
MTQRMVRRVVWLATVALGVCATTSQSQSVSLGALSKPIQAALEETEFRSWPLQWVTELDYEGFRYTVLYGQKDKGTALILLRTDLATSKAIIIKNDTSLFPFNERANTPPEEVRLALAEGEMRRQLEKYGNWQAYVQALRKANLFPYLSKEQREILRNRGFGVR